MSNTKSIPRGEWHAYFERLTKAFLRDEAQESVSIEQLAGELGDQVAVSNARLLGITWDEKDELLEIALEDLDHIVLQPRDIFVVEEDDGFVSAMEVVHEDQTREIVKIRRAAPMQRPFAQP